MRDVGGAGVCVAGPGTVVLGTGRIPPSAPAIGGGRVVEGIEGMFGMNIPGELVGGAPMLGEPIYGAPVLGELMIGAPMLCEPMYGALVLGELMIGALMLGEPM